MNWIDTQASFFLGTTRAKPIADASRLFSPLPLPMRYPSLETATDPITTKSSITLSSMPENGKLRTKPKCMFSTISYSTLSNSPFITSVQEIRETKMISIVTVST